MTKQATDLRPVVIVSEDEVLVRVFAADFLDEAGFKVFEAADADEALVLLRDLPNVEALVTDVEMPKGSMNGFELVRRIREQLPKVAILIVSGRAHPQQHDLPNGALFMTKPYDPALVVRSLNGLIAHRDTRKPQDG